MNEDFMRRAIELAKRGTGLVNPNPLVGCVIVKDGQIVAEGWHERYGGFHAERNALLSCTEDVRGAEMYVTLEPCCHTGKTPPCTDIIIERGIGKVYVGSDDPNPLVAGHGIELLRESGIEVETHILKEECDALNEIFFHYITTKMPFVAMKYAMTLDGKIARSVASKRAASAGDPASSSSDGSALSSGQSTSSAQSADDILSAAYDRQYSIDALESHSPQSRNRRASDMYQTERLLVTGNEANAHVHALRKQYRAILVGVGTVINDDPMLNYRGPDAGADAADRTPDLFSKPGFDPIRIILDSHLRIPLSSQIVKTASTVPTIIACSEDAFDIEADTSHAESTMSASEKKRQLTQAGVRVIVLPAEKPADDDVSVLLSRKTDRKVSLEALFKKLGESGIDSILVEGGARIHSSLFMRPDLVNRVYAYFSPTLIGKGLPPIDSVAAPLELSETELIQLGKDICLTGKIN